MKSSSLRNAVLGMIAVLALGTPAHANERLADVMGLIAEQYGGLTEVSKMVAKDVDEKTFKKAMSRARAGAFLFTVLDEKKGSIDQGLLVPGEITPDKILPLTDQALIDKMAEYEDFLSQAGTKFLVIETEVSTQFKAVADQRDFAPFKKMLLELNAIMRKAHTEFK